MSPSSEDRIVTSSHQTFSPTPSQSKALHAVPEQACTALIPEASDVLQATLLDRDHSILAFNERVFDWAVRADVPLLERVRFLTIVSSNLDEFFEVRAAPHLAAARSGETKGPCTQASFEALSAKAHDLVARQYALYNDDLVPALDAHGIRIISHGRRTAAQRRWVREYFRREVRPLLIPVGLDPAHPFPQVANKSLNFIVRLKGGDAFGRENEIAIVKIPRALPRLIRMPAAVAAKGAQCVSLSSVVRAHLEDLFPERQVTEFSQFRVTRHSDLAVDEEDVRNLRTALRQGLQQRHYGEAVRLEVSAGCSDFLSDFLRAQFNLPAPALYRVHGPVNLVRLGQLIDLADAPNLLFKPSPPCWPQQMQQGGSIQAVRRGKEVLAVVELKARFDEEANINWAEALESVGAQVVYGVVGLKTHAKMLLVTRREGRVLRRYGHLSTGNYNPRTARLYTDLSYLTADEDTTADMDNVFNHLASQNRLPRMRRLLVAPFHLHRRTLEKIEQVGLAAAQGKDARIVAKMNALTDEALVRALLLAGQRGARIDLIVRGACILPAQVPGVTDNIRVRSIIGRFLEHSRVFYFRAGEQEELYLSSADWMNRNMLRRVEVSWPVTDPVLRQRIVDECLVAYLCDDRDAWNLQPDGVYARSSPDGSGTGVQNALMHRYARSTAAGGMK